METMVIFGIGFFGGAAVVAVCNITKEEKGGKPW
jgi:hypothetical protein